MDVTDVFFLVFTGYSDKAFHLFVLFLIPVFISVLSSPEDLRSRPLLRLPSTRF